MANWKSPDEIALDNASFNKLMHSLLGLYIWEYLTTLPFDLQYVRGRRPFKWPLIFYFAGRYTLLFALIGIAVALNVTRPINCQALYIYNQMFVNAAFGIASLNLSLRTMGLWAMAWYIVFPLVALIIGHWSLLLHGVLLKAIWVPGQGCVINRTSNTILAGSFIYSMCFDFVVLALMAARLGVSRSAREYRSGLMKLLFDDGVIFFVISFTTNLVATTFMLLNFNAVMSIIANVPAAIASTIAACRVVRHLSHYAHNTTQVLRDYQPTSLAFRHAEQSKTHTGRGYVERSPEGIHIEMNSLQLPPRIYSRSGSSRLHSNISECSA